MEEAILGGTIWGPAELPTSRAHLQPEDPSEEETRRVEDS